MTDTNQDFRGKYTQGNRLTRRLLDGFFAAVGELAAGLEISSAVEVGCGEGFSTQRLRAMLPARVSLEASDVEERLVAAAAERNPGVPVRPESVYELSRADASADLVLSLEVLEHLDDPARALRELCRVSRRWLVVSVPREPLWRCMNLARLKYVASLGNTPGHLNHWTSGGFARFVGRFAAVRAVRRPVPWTIVLAEKS